MLNNINGVAAMRGTVIPVMFPFDTVSFNVIPLTIVLFSIVPFGSAVLRSVPLTIDPFNAAINPMSVSLYIKPAIVVSLFCNAFVIFAFVDVNSGVVV